MKLSDIEKYVGIEYVEDAFDCVDLVMLVQRELFGREVQLPQKRPRGVVGARRMRKIALTKTRRRDDDEQPQQGDLVLMQEPGDKYPAHAGVAFWLDHEWWVMHANERDGHVVLHRARLLSSYGARIEGYYEWNSN